MKKLLLLSLALAAAACAGPVNQKSASIHANSGAIAARNGDWDASRKHWAKAVVNAELAKAAPAQLAVAYYEYGRALGVTCYFTESEQYLLKALAADQQSSGPAYNDYVELGRLMLNTRNYAKSAQYFSQGLAAMASVDAANRAPTEYANILDEYARALQGAGDSTAAQQYAQQAQTVRVKYPGGHSITDRTPYGTQCAK